MRKALSMAFVVGFLAAVLWLLSRTAWKAAQGSSAMPLMSAYRYDPYGDAALYEYLLKSKHAVSLLTRPVLSPHMSGVLINLWSPHSRGILQNYSTSTHYNPDLLHWVAAGNTLVDMVQGSTGLGRHFHLAMTWHKRVGRHTAGKHESGGAFQPGRTADSGWRRWYDILRRGQSPKRLTRWLDDAAWGDHSPAAMSLPLWHRTLWLLDPAVFVLPKTHAPWHTLARSKAGPVAIMRPYGRGRIVMIGSVWPALNGGISQGGNLDFLMHIIGSQPVILDQWSRGVGHNPSVLVLLRRVGGLPACVELLLVLAVWSWSLRGYPRPIGLGPRRMARSTAEQIAALGRLYQESLTPQELAHRVAAECTRRFAEALKCRPDGLAERINRQPVELQQAFARMNNRLAALQMDAANMNQRVHRRQAALRKALADMLTQSWKLAKELHRDGNSRIKPQGQH